jgi:hypothetical protein
MVVNAHNIMSSRLHFPGFRLSLLRDGRHAACPDSCEFYFIFPSDFARRVGEQRLLAKVVSLALLVQYTPPYWLALFVGAKHTETHKNTPHHTWALRQRVLRPIRRLCDESTTEACRFGRRKKEKYNRLQWNYPLRYEYERAPKRAGCGCGRGQPVVSPNWLMNISWGCLLLAACCCACQPWSIVNCQL